MKTNRLLAGLLMTVLVSGSAFAATPLSVTEANPTISQDFNSTDGLSLPDGWAVNKHIGGFRVIDSWADAADAVEMTAGANLASNATNGTYYFSSSSDASDRALGGVTTNATDKTNTVSVMTAFTNNSDKTINSVDIAYALEKYRKEKELGI